jgi:hypothetical protein
MNKRQPSSTRTKDEGHALWIHMAIRLLFVGLVALEVWLHCQGNLPEPAAFYP